MNHRADFVSRFQPKDGHERTKLLIMYAIEYQARRLFFFPSFVSKESRFYFFAPFCLHTSTVCLIMSVALASIFIAVSGHENFLGDFQ